MADSSVSVEARDAAFAAVSSGALSVCPRGTSADVADGGAGIVGTAPGESVETEAGEGGEGGESGPGRPGFGGVFSLMAMASASRTQNDERPHYPPA